MKQSRKQPIAAADETSAQPTPSFVPIGRSHSALSGLITDELRKGILSGRYKPMERLVEDRLSRDLGVSRIPVREALRALAAEGLVDIIPRRGAMVAGLSREDAREMVEVRATLEGLNARLAARRRNPKIIEELNAVLKEGDSVTAAGDIQAFIQLNAKFHELLAKAGSNSILSDLMRTLRNRTNPLFALLSPNKARQSWQEHAAILKAVIDGDADLAALLATRHVTNAAADLLVETGSDGDAAQAERTAAKGGHG